MSLDGFIKITEEMIYHEVGKLPLCEWVSGIFTGHCCDYEYSLADAIVDCESPIEQAMALEMERIGLFNSRYFTAGEIDIVSIDKQVVLQVNEKKYRVDFLIPVVYHIKQGNFGKLFVVECDGHDYHEKTKEQVAKNNQRERDLKSAGYEVVRFSGSEIYKSPHKCIKDLLRIISSQRFEVD